MILTDASNSVIKKGRTKVADKIKGLNIEAIDKMSTNQAQEQFKNIKNELKNEFGILFNDKDVYKAMLFVDSEASTKMAALLEKAESTQEIKEDQGSINVRKRQSKKKHIKINQKTSFLRLFLIHSLKQLLGMLLVTQEESIELMLLQSI